MGVRPEMTLFMALDLARRLERTEGAINASFVEARRRLSPEVNPVWHDFGGTYAMFDGIDSPMTQTFGLGVFEPASGGVVAGIEAFFFERGADVCHEVCTLAGFETHALLADRGYRPVEVSTVLVRSLVAEPDGAASTPGVGVRAVTPGDSAVWIETSVAGWSENADVAEPIRRVATVAFVNPAVLSFLAEWDGKPMATGSLGIHEGVALLAGASTLPDHRGRGAQRALLAARLSVARERGCDLAMMAAEPGSTSQRNAERNGFAVAYTRMKWKLSRTDAQ